MSGPCSFSFDQPTVCPAYSCVDAFCLSRVAFLVPTVKISPFVVLCETQDDMLASKSCFFFFFLFSVPPKMLQIHKMSCSTFAALVFCFISPTLHLIYQDLPSHYKTQHGLVLKCASYMLTQKINK